MSSSSSLGNRDVIATTTDSVSLRYQYNAYPPRQSDASSTDSVPLSSNLPPGRAGGDGIGNRVPSSTRGAAALNSESNESSGLSLPGGPPLSGPALPATSKRWLVSSGMSRRLREFIPDFRKDQEYWQKRQKNNEAAKRSREKRRINDVVMGKRIYELSSENKRLRLELEAIKRHFGYPLNLPYPIDAVTLAASTAPGRPESPMMFADMSSGESDEEDSESSQSRQVVVSGAASHGGGLEYHRQQPSTQDTSTTPSTTIKLSDQHHSSSSEGAAVDGATYLRTSNNTSAGRLDPDLSNVGYRQPHRPQHYLPMKISDVPSLGASGGGRHPTVESFNRFAPESLDSAAGPQMQKMTSSTTSKSSAALARAEVLERLAICRAKQSAEQQMKSYERASSRRYDDRGDSYEYRGQYFDHHRHSPSFRSASDVDSRSDERGLMLHDDSMQGCVSGNRDNNGAFNSRDLNDESSWQLKHQPLRRIKVETSAQSSRWNDGDLGFSDVSSDADDARVQFSIAERSRPLEHRSEVVLRGSREAPLNLTKRLRLSALHGSSARVARSIEDEQSMRFSAHEEMEMPPLLMRTNHVMLSRSTSGDVKMVPNVNSPTSSPTCSSAPVPEFLLRSPPSSHSQQQLIRSRTDSPQYHSATSESSSSQWIHSRNQNLPSNEYAPLSLPNIGTLTSGSRALRYSQRSDELSLPHVVAQSHVVSTDDYISDHSSDAANISTRRRLKLEEEAEDAASKSSEVINRHVRGGVPLKVWHKRSSAQAPGDDWPEDVRYDSLSPRLERHGSSTKLFHPSRDSEPSSLLADTNYAPESVRRRTESDRSCALRLISQSDEDDVRRISDNDLGSVVGGGGGYRGEGRERVSLQTAVHLPTLSLNELEGCHTGKQQQQQQNSEARNFDTLPPFD